MLEVKLHDIEKHMFPLVKVAFQGKDGKVYVGFMLVDTSSVNNILNKSILQLIDSLNIIGDKSKVIMSIHSEPIECQGADFTFKLGSEVFTEMFYINNNLDFDQMFEGLIGIIGLDFLIKHHLVLDYVKESLYTSDVVERDYRECGFFFPMSFGVERYNLPVVGLICNDLEFVMVVDSGANSTVLTKHVIEKADLAVNSEYEQGVITGFSNKPMNTYIQDVRLSLLSIGDSECHNKICTYEDKVQVIGESQYLLDGIKDYKGNELLPISGLLSSSFMYTYRWVLDFGTGVMYSCCGKR